MSLVRQLWIGDAHDNLQGFSKAIVVANSQGVGLKRSLGDLLFEFSSQGTKNHLLKRLQLKQLLKQGKNPQREAIKKGIYSDEQLEYALGDYSRIARDIAVMKYEKFAATDHDLLLVQGNWDLEEEVSRIFADHVLDGVVKEEEGIRTGYFSGGGDPPAGGTGLMEGFASDYFEKGIAHINSVRKTLLNPDNQSLDQIVSHVPIVSISGQHVDQYNKQGDELLLQMHELGLELPKVIIYGHHHHGFKWTWETIKTKKGKDIYVPLFSPGVIAFEHNDGAFGTFCISHTDENTKQIVKVEEYRVFNSGDKQKVMHYADHSINHQARKVNTDHIKKIVAVEPVIEYFAEKYALDQGFKKGKVLPSIKGLSIKGLSTEEADKTLRGNFQALNQELDKSAKDLKSAINKMQNEYLNLKDNEHKLSSKEEREAQNIVIEELLVIIGKELGIDFSTYDDFGHFQKNILMEIYYGFAIDGGSDNAPSIRSAISINGKKVSEIPYNIGLSEETNLANIAQNKIWNRCIPLMAKELEVAQLADIVDKVYKPLSVKRKKEVSEMDRMPLLNLWYGGWKQGLLTEKQFTNTGIYENTEFTANKKTDDEINDLAGIKYGTGEPSKIRMPRDDLSQLESELGNRINVFRSEDDDYVIAKNGTRVYLPENDLNYETITPKDLLDNEQAVLVSGGDQYYLHTGEVEFPIDLEEEGINPNDYEVIPKWRMLQQQNAQQNYMNQLREQAFQNQVRELQQQRNQSSRGTGQIL